MHAILISILCTFVFLKSVTAILSVILHSEVRQKGTFGNVVGFCSTVTLYLIFWIEWFFLPNFSQFWRSINTHDLKQQTFTIFACHRQLSLMSRSYQVSSNRGSRDYLPLTIIYEVRQGRSTQQKGIFSKYVDVL